MQAASDETRGGRGEMNMGAKLGVQPDGIGIEIWAQREKNQALV